MRHTITIIAILLVAVFFTGCNGSSITGPGNTGNLKLLVANSLGETLSVVTQTETGTWEVQKDILPTGQAANDIVVDGDRAYIICSLSNSVHVVKTKDMTTVREISTGDASNPFAGALAPDGTLWVTLTLTNQLIQIDPEATPAIISTTALPPASEMDDSDPSDENQPWPEGIVYHKGKVYVAFSNLDSTFMPGGKGAVAVIDASSGDVTDTIILNGKNAVDVYSPDLTGDTLYFIEAGDYFVQNGGLVEVYDVVSGTITGSVQFNGSPFEMVMAASGAAFLTNGAVNEILRFDTSNLTPWPAITVPGSGLAYNFVSEITYLGGNNIAVLEFNGDHFFVMDGVTGDVKSELVVGDGPNAMAAI